MCALLPSPTFELAQLAVDNGAVHEGTDVGRVGVYHLDTQARTVRTQKDYQAQRS